MVFYQLPMFAGVVELVDTRDLKSLGSDTVPVQIRSAAPKKAPVRVLFCCIVSYL